MSLRRVVRYTLWSLLGITILAAAVAGWGWWYFHPSYQRQDAVVYGERRGHPLTLDWIRPTHPNGLGVALMVSGGWKSSPPGRFPAWMVAPLLRRGYTIFAVCHVSQPEATIAEIVEDVNRGVRFIRHHATDYGIDARRLGVTGGSAGGHLSLMLCTLGGPGPATAADPVDRESSAVQAAAVFYPPTDLLNLGASTENPGDGGPPKSFVRGFGPGATNLATWKPIGRQLSPIYHITTNLPPILILHGGADTLVTPDQSERFQSEARRLGQQVELIIRPGQKHGWLSMVWDIRLFADWFDRYLKPDSRS
jgi:acetyl esterase/lipase